jgi:AcrR family transcriptional regulator
MLATAVQHRADALRQRICTAASTLFIRRGFGATSMQDIADALRISRPKLYYYFRDKASILETLVSNVPVEAHRRAQAVLARKGLDAKARLRELILQHADLILSRPHEFRLLDMSLEHLPRAMQARAHKAKRGLLEAFAAVIRHGIADRMFRSTDPKVAAFGLIGMCNWTAAWYRSDGRLSAPEICAVLADLGVGSVIRGPERRPSVNGVSSSLRMLRESVQNLEAALLNPG